MFLLHRVFLTLAAVLLSAQLALAAQVDLSWTDTCSGETGMQVQHVTSTGGGLNTLANLAAGVTAYSDHTAPNGGNRCYRIACTHPSTPPILSNIVCVDVPGMTGTAPVLTVSIP